MPGRPSRSGGATASHADPRLERGRVHNQGCSPSLEGACQHGTDSVWGLSRRSGSASCERETISNRRWGSQHPTVKSTDFFRISPGIADFFRSEHGIFRGFKEFFGDFVLISFRSHAGILRTFWRSSLSTHPQGKGSRIHAAKGGTMRGLHPAGRASERKAHGLPMQEPPHGARSARREAEEKSLRHARCCAKC